MKKGIACNQNLSRISRSGVLLTASLSSAEVASTVGELTTRGGSPATGGDIHSHSDVQRNSFLSSSLFPKAEISEHLNKNGSNWRLHTQTGLGAK